MSNLSSLIVYQSELFTELDLIKKYRIMYNCPGVLIWHLHRLSFMTYSEDMVWNFIFLLRHNRLFQSNFEIATISQFFGSFQTTEIRLLPKLEINLNQQLKPIAPKSSMQYAMF